MTVSFPAVSSTNSHNNHFSETDVLLDQETDLQETVNELVNAIPQEILNRIARLIPNNQTSRAASVPTAVTKIATVKKAKPYAPKGKKWSSPKLEIACPRSSNEMTEVLVSCFSQAQKTNKDVFIRDTKLTGFCLKITPHGCVSSCVEIFANGKSYRKTIAKLNVVGFGNEFHKDGLTVEQARVKAAQVIAEIRGENELYPMINAATTLNMLLNQYLQMDLKKNTKDSYRGVVEKLLYDWLDLDVRLISKQMIADRFVRIRDYGFNGSKPSHSQASKVFRVLSTFMEYAKGYDMVENNPCEVLRQRKLKKFTSRKTTFLTERQANKVINFICESDQRQYLAVKFILYSGLRKQECFGLKWSEIKNVDGVKCIVLDPERTKAKRIHIIPVSEKLGKILDQCRKSSGNDATDQRQL